MRNKRSRSDSFLNFLSTDRLCISRKYSNNRGCLPYFIPSIYMDVANTFSPEVLFAIYPRKGYRLRGSISTLNFDILSLSSLTHIFQNLFNDQINPKYSALYRRKKFGVNPHNDKRLIFKLDNHTIHVARKDGIVYG